MRDDRRRGQPKCPGFLSPFGRRHSLLGHPLPAGELGLPHGRLTGPCHQVSDPNGVVTFRTHEMRPERVPSLPRGQRCPHDRQVISGRRLPHPSGRVPRPQRSIPSPGLLLTRHHRGFTSVHPPGLPLACDPRMEQGPLGFSPELHTPPLPATHVRVGTGVGHLPELRHHQLVLLPTQPLTACALVAH